MQKTIAVLAGDGIGPEIMSAAIKVLETINQKFKHQIITRAGLAGGEAYERYGAHLPAETIAICEESQAILFGAVGGPVDAGYNPKWKDVEKNVILGLRKKFDLFANLRPLKTWPAILSASPLKPELLAGVDILILRELVSGIYFGPRRQYERNGEKMAEDVNFYSWGEIERIIRLGFASARLRRQKLTVVDKANVLDTSRLWREVAKKVSADFPDIQLEFMFVDNAAAQLACSPASFDVIVTENMFGDILSDLGGAVVGSIGILPSACLNSRGFGLYEPVHGSAPDIAGQNIANPTAQILSLAMLLRHSFGLNSEAQKIEQTIISVWEQGGKTKDLARPGENYLSTEEFTRQVCKNIN